MHKERAICETPEKLPTFSVKTCSQALTAGNATNSAGEMTIGMGGGT
jgi:hypothetical protein